LKVKIAESAATTDSTLEAGAQRVIGNRYSHRRRKSGTAQHRYLACGGPKKRVHVQQYRLLPRGQNLAIGPLLFATRVEQEAVVVRKSRLGAHAGIDGTQTERIDPAVLRLRCARAQPEEKDDQALNMPSRSTHAELFTVQEVLHAYRAAVVVLEVAKRRRP